MADLSGKYEVVVPVVTEDGIKPMRETVELTHEDAETFLRRGFVKEHKRPQQSSGRSKKSEPGEE